MPTNEKSEKTFKIVGNDISDGYHTFDELYEHRITLYLALCRKLAEAETRENFRNRNPGPISVWRSALHSDGTNWDGWFLLGIFTEKGEQITYHLPMTKWIDTNFAVTLDRAPEFDGHTSQDVLERISKL